MKKHQSNPINKPVFTKKKAFECSCGGHRLVVTYTEYNDGDSDLSFIIENHRSNQTGKLIKKPKLEADVVFYDYNGVAISILPIANVLDFFKEIAEKRKK